MIVEPKRYLFVYGTLRSVFNHPLHGVLMTHGELVGHATLPGRLYDVGDYPAAVCQPDDTDEVIHGELYYLRDSYRIFDKLDRYEGYIAPGTGRSEYRREYRDVCLSTGDRVKAWVYLYNLRTDALTRIPSGDYLQWLGKENG